MLTGVDVIIIYFLVVITVLVSIIIGFSLGRQTAGEKGIGEKIVEAIKPKPKKVEARDPYFEAMNWEPEPPVDKEPPKPKRIPTVE
ncbi:MAG: hypothetical protein LLG40_09810 [Deltaproteobacteria bacterium]|nr:hypothetical protein [Deltaproteobacteria bacterium]